MARVDIRSNEAATFGGQESTFGTAPSTSRLTIVTGSFNAAPNQTELPVNTESVYLHDNQTTVQGLKSDGSTCSFATYVQMRAAKLSSSTLTPNAWETLMWTLCGGMTPASGANVGDTNTGGTATAIDVSSATDFTAGDWITAPVGSSCEPARVASKASNTLTCNPGLSASPAGSGNVCHMVTFYPSDTNTLSYAIQHAKAGNANEQYEFSGCTGDISLKMDRNAIVETQFSLRAASWQRGALSLSTAVGNDGRGTCFVNAGGKTLLQATATATATHYSVEECSVDLKLGMTHLPSVTGDVQGVVGVMRVGERMAAEITLTVAMDTTWITGWSAQTDYQFMLAIPQGSGSAKQWFVFHAPKCQIVGVPQPVPSGDGRVRYQLKLHPKIDSSGSTAALRAPWTIACG